MEFCLGFQVENVDEQQLTGFPKNGVGGKTNEISEK